MTRIHRLRPLFLFVLLASLQCGNAAKTLAGLSAATVASTLESPLDQSSLLFHSLHGLSLDPIAGAATAAAGYGGGAEGFCSAEPSSKCSGDQPLYWKVTHPTLAPAHLQGA
jgi:hypothetical protein